MLKDALMMKIEASNGWQRSEAFRPYLFRIRQENLTMQSSIWLATGSMLLGQLLLVV